MLHVWRGGVNLWHLVSLCVFTWVLGLKFRSSGLHKNNTLTHWITLAIQTHFLYKEPRHSDSSTLVDDRGTQRLHSHRKTPCAGADTVLVRGAKHQAQKQFCIVLHANRWEKVTSSVSKSGKRKLYLRIHLSSPSACRHVSTGHGSELCAAVRERNGSWEKNLTKDLTFRGESSKPRAFLRPWDWIAHAFDVPFLVHGASSSWVKKKCHIIRLQGNAKENNNCTPHKMSQVERPDTELGKVWGNWNSHTTGET